MVVQNLGRFDGHRQSEARQRQIGSAELGVGAVSVALVTGLIHNDHTPKLRFEVTDSGRRMSAEHVAGWFRPFNQGDNARTREFGGTGLGLAISHRFAELVEGDITRVRTKVGVGSIFPWSVGTGPLDGVQMQNDPIAATSFTKK